MKKLLLILFCVGWWAEAEAQVFEPGDGPRRVRTDGFWSDWFVQADLDMTLQNPYGYNFANVFPNGKSFGLDVAVGKALSGFVRAGLITQFVRAIAWLLA